MKNSRVFTIVIKKKIDIENINYNTVAYGTLNYESMYLQLRRTRSFAFSSKSIGSSNDQNPIEAPR